MSAYIQYDSLSKPRFRADICRPVDALKLFNSNEWDSLVIVGEAGLSAIQDAGATPEQYCIKLNPSQMNRIQDCAVIKREGLVALPAWVAWAAVGVSIAASVYSYIAAKNIKTPENINRTQESPNNRIQNRGNSERLGQRVEYIVGQVTAFPTKMTKEYIVIENNEQVEYGYYSFGEGLLDVSKLQDGRTPAKLIAGWDGNIYGPNQSPMTGDTPIIAAGALINEPLRTTFESDESVRDEIEPPNDLSLNLDIRLTGNNDGTMTIDVIDPPDDYSLNGIYTVGSSAIFSGVFATGQNGTKTLYKYSFSGGSSGSGSATFTPVNVPNLDYIDISELADTTAAAYDVESVSPTSMVVKLDPALSTDQVDAINRMVSTKIDRSFIERRFTEDPNGLFFTTDGTELYYGVADATTGDLTYEISNTSNKTVNGILNNTTSAILGPFAGQTGVKSIQFNLMSDGLLKDAGQNKLYNVTVTGTCTVREIDEDGSPTGNIHSSDWSLSSNPENKRKQAGKSFFVTHTFEHYTVEFKRETNRDFNFNGSVQDVVELTELYFVRYEPSGKHYGNKTTMQTRRKQSTFGVGKSQKINALVESIYPDGKSRYFDDSLYYMSLNGKFGRRTQQQADRMRTHLRSIRDEVVAYFGNEEAAYFDYTFDSTDITFESAVNQVAKAVFCNAYQIGSDIRFFPDLKQDVDAMVFSHSAKQLGKQTLKYSFQDLQEKGYDCVEIKWRNPANQDAQESIYIPSQGTNQKTIELVGIRNKKKAEIHGWREWNRIKHQRFSYECYVGVEATHLVPGRRIGIVNNIIGVNMDGFIKKWNGDRLIEVSQDVDVSAGGYVLVLNMPTGGTEAFNVTQGVDENGDTVSNRLLLDRKPVYDINTMLLENSVQFRVAKDTDVARDSYSTQEVKLTDKGIQIVGVNYAPEQYEKDDLMKI